LYFHSSIIVRGEILVNEQKNVERLGIFDRQTIIGTAQLYYNDLPFGWRYAFSPKGPLLYTEDQSLICKAYEALAEYLRNKKCIFLRVEPSFIPKQSSLSFRKSIDLHMPTTLLLDLQKTSEELLADMHQKTRYNIRLAQKKGLVLSEEKNSTSFWRLSQKTSERDRFRLHPESHYQAMIDSPFVHQLSLRYQNTDIVSGIFVGYGDTFSYLHGASDYEYRTLMAPYLLQWSAIEKAKSLGYRWYDFYGLAPENRSESRTSTDLITPDDYVYDPECHDAGFTRFKLGFGGIVEATPGTWDIVIDEKKYSRYQLFRGIRRYLKFIP
jgi:lipid II:glycine glycyltransferase (peptidoglycan interpeptide bridge formation enzyme)